MQQRYYDPQIGRFLSVDPARSEFNRYNYASNNPYRFTDPDGRQSADRKEAMHLGTWLKAWVSNDFDPKKADAAVEKVMAQDRKAAEVVIDVGTRAGIIKDAIVVVSQTASGKDPTPKGAGALAGDAASRVTESALKGKIGDGAAEVVGSVVGQMVGGATESAVEGAGSTHSEPKARSQRESKPVKEEPKAKGHELII